MENKSSGHSGQKSKSVRTHITIGNDEIITNIYEVPTPAVQKKPARVVSTLKEAVQAFDCLYFAQGPIVCREQFRSKTHK